MIFEVQYCDAVLSRLQKNSLLLIEHAHGIHRMLEECLKQHFPLAINMHHAVSPLCYQCQKHKAIVEPCMQIKNLLVFLWQFHVVVSVQDHE